MKEVKNSYDKWKFKLQVKQCYLIVSSVGKILKVKTKKS